MQEPSGICPQYATDVPQEFFFIERLKKIKGVHFALAMVNMAPLDGHKNTRVNNAI